MPTRPSPPGWYVISLRPRGEHVSLRRAAADHGGGLIALSPWRLQARDDTLTRTRLREATSATRVVFTSPPAVRAAARLQPLTARSDQHWCAVGAGTAAALRRAGIAQVQAPARMNSEGLLALPALCDIEDVDVGLITAPGGRGVLLPALQARGARVIRADVYERVPVAPSASALAALRALDAPAVLALSSGEALQRTLASVPADVAGVLRNTRVVAASARLVELAHAHGFERVKLADGPRPTDLVAAAALE